MLALAARIVVLLACLLPVPALAAAFATVDQLSTLDSTGRWRPVAETGRARVITGGAEEPLRVGREVALGDRIVTDDARVRVRLASGEDIAIDERSDIELGERSVVQRLGDAYYRVRGAFRVTHGAVQTSVEGTEFSVATGAVVTVAVVEGRVAVRNESGEVRVARGQVVEVAQVGAPPGPQWNPAVARQAVARTFPRGGPTLQVGLLAAGGLANGGAVVEGRLFARLRLLPGVRLALDTGLGNDGSETGVRLPQGLGVEFDAGGFSLGGQLITSVERCNFECGGAYVALHLGGVGNLRYALPLSRHFSIEGLVRAGYADGLVIDAGLGIGASL